LHLFPDSDRDGDARGGPIPAAGFVNPVPREGAALVFCVERPLDMFRSSTNLLGQLVNATFVDAAEKRAGEA